MCNFASFVILKNTDAVWLPDSDSHGDLLAMLNLSDMTADPDRMAFARVEISPPGGDVFAPVDDQWTLKIDERITPRWWSERHERKAWAALREKLVAIIIDGGTHGEIKGRRGLYIRNAKIDRLIDSEVREMYDSSQVREMHGSSQVGAMYGSSQVRAMYGSSQVGAMYGSSQVLAMYDYSSQVLEMHGSSQVGAMYGSSQVREMYDSSQVREMHGLSQVLAMYGLSQVRAMYGSSTAMRRTESGITLLHAPGLSATI